VESQPDGQPIPGLLALWAKTSGSSSSSEPYHPVLCHLLDIAAVAQCMWEQVLSPWSRRQIAVTLGIDGSAAGRWVAFWAGTHDIGKCSPAFQQQHAPGKARLMDSGYRFYAAADRAPHGTISARALRDDLLPELDLTPRLATRVAQLVGGHHGLFPSALQIGAVSTSALGKGRWKQARAELTRHLSESVQLPDERPVQIDNASALLLAGLISVADWIGSNTEYFPYAVLDGDAPLPVELSDYVAEYTVQAQSNAQQALQRLGWLGWTPPTQLAAFTELFPWITEPNDMQDTLIARAGAIKEPSLFIVEAPMGEGKTEGAMYLADRWSAAFGERGCYFALPTTATSDQMFNRVHDYLLRRYPSDVVNLQLLHGRSALSAEFTELQRNGERLFTPSEIDLDGGAGALPGVVATEWFTYRKRGLLAPFGVGTVDQGLLGILQTRHVFVRLFGMAHKTVIIDEVHAYDVYMTTLLERLLEWLAALGSSVVLLSATLPASRRQRLLDAYLHGAGQSDIPRPESKPYPRVTWVSSASAGSATVETSLRSQKTVHLDWIDGELPNGSGGIFPLGERLREALRAGGCAAVICNTVNRAQAVYCALKPYFPAVADDGEPELDLFHARFLYDQRDRRTRRAMRRFGKPGGSVAAEDGTERPVRRPQRAVLVATQVIEQSLDLDFDLMVSDHAPVDLLLQRAGRLHRHQRQRPAPLEQTSLWLTRPEEVTDDVPRFDGGTMAIYDAHILLRSWLALRDRSTIVIPDEVEYLVEFVYGEQPCSDASTEHLRQAWHTTQQELVQLQDKHESFAQRVCIPSPTAPGNVLEHFNLQLEEESPESHRSIQAQTRLGDPSVDVVLLTARERAALPSRTPTVKEAERLLKRAVGVSNRRVVPRLLDPTRPAPTAWQRSALLRHHRLVVLDDPNGPYGNPIGGYVFDLDDEVGLTITKVNKED